MEILHLVLAGYYLKGNCIPRKEFQYLIKKKKKVSIFRDMREGKEEIFISLKE